jgi:DNA-binding transcriptional ArsR family regulator
MYIGHLSPSTSAPARAEVVAGTAFDVLVGLAAASAGRVPAAPELRAALDEVGDSAGESWLNLLGVPIDLGPPYDAARLAREVAAMDPVELRRQLLGRYAWSWCTLAGTDTIEAAAAGDDAAAGALLAHDRYYAGQAKASLSTLVRLDPEQTRAVLAGALEAGAKELGRDADALERAASAAADGLERAPLVDAIETITGGYRYVPEVEAERVLLVPHVQPSPWLVLVQHRGARVIVYGRGADGGLEERVAALGRALADPKRVEILKLLGRGTDRVSRLVSETGLTRSTVHHHLTQLREARLVDLEGNARAYRYRLRDAAFTDSMGLLSELLEERAP